MERVTLEEFIGSVPVSRRRRKAIERELRGHLAETQLELQQEGWSSEAAARESLLRLGNPEEIAEAFGHVYRPSRRRRVSLAAALAGALVLGAYGGGTFASATSAHKATHPKVAHVSRALRCDHR